MTPMWGIPSKTDPQSGTTFYGYSKTQIRLNQVSNKAMEHLMSDEIKSYAVDILITLSQFCGVQVHQSRPQTNCELRLRIARRPFH